MHTFLIIFTLIIGVTLNSGAHQDDADGLSPAKTRVQTMFPRLQGEGLNAFQNFEQGLSHRGGNYIEAILNFGVNYWIQHPDAPFKSVLNLMTTLTYAEGLLPRHINHITTTFLQDFFDQIDTKVEYAVLESLMGIQDMDITQKRNLCFLIQQEELLVFETEPTEILDIFQNLRHAVQNYSLQDIQNAIQAMGAHDTLSEVLFSLWAQEETIGDDDSRSTTSEEGYIMHEQSAEALAAIRQMEGYQYEDGRFANGVPGSDEDGFDGYS